jgi:hypothetical protein
MRALAALPADPDIRAVLLDRAASDEYLGARQAAVQALAALPDPDIRALLLNRAANDPAQEVYRVALNIILSANPEDPAVEPIISARADMFANNWNRQLLVRFASCSSNFQPEALPSIYSSQGILGGSL